LLIWVQALLGTVSLTLAILTALGVMTPWLLLVLVLAGCVGAALAAPAWQSSVPEMVPRADLSAAVALNSMGINVSRAIGPALGGLILAMLGVAATYLADAFSYVFAIAALLWWHRQAAVMEGPRETLPGAMRAGLRYAANSAPLHRCCCARPCSSCSARRIGRCCRCWPARCSAAARHSTARCWRASARAPSEGRSPRPGCGTGWAGRRA
jgi:hypothetical protein